MIKIDQHKKCSRVYKTQDEQTDLKSVEYIFRKYKPCSEISLKAQLTTTTSPLPNKQTNKTHKHRRNFEL